MRLGWSSPTSIALLGSIRRILPGQETFQYFFLRTAWRNQRHRHGIASSSFPGKMQRAVVDWKCGRSWESVQFRSTHFDASDCFSRNCDASQPRPWRFFDEKNMFANTSLEKKRFKILKAPCLFHVFPSVLDVSRDSVPVYTLIAHHLCSLWPQAALILKASPF